MNTGKIVYLHITSYAGMSLGAEHYYGEMKSDVYEDEGITIEFKMSQREAAKLSKKDDWNYRTGSTSSRFDNKQDIINIALKTYKQHFPNARMLVLGDRVYAEPQLILECDNHEFQKRNNELCEEIERIGGWEGNKKRMHEIEKEWDILIAKVKA